MRRYPWTLWETEVAIMLLPVDRGKKLSTADLTGSNRRPIPLELGCHGCDGRQRARGIAIIVVLALGGCGSWDALPTKEVALPTKEVPPPFVGSGSPGECAARCIPVTEYIARAELGLDPIELGKETSGDYRAVFRGLKTQSKATGGIVRSVSVAELLHELKEGTMRPTVLVDKKGHLYLILGVLNVDGEFMCQLVHGDMPVSLVSKAQITHAGFQEAWRLERKAEGVPIHVGSGSVRINKVYHNFGEVNPDKKLECTFSLKNVGNTTLLLDKPRASCSCATTSALENTRLGPTETKVVGVAVQSTNAASQRYSVVLRFFEKGTGVSRQVELLLIASQRKSMEVAPARLDFGLVVSGRSYSRTVRMSEVPSDRFVLKKVDAGKLPIVHEIEATKDKDGLATYRIRLGLEVDDRWSGKHTGELGLTTDSHVRPQVTIPVEFEIAPLVRAIPSVVSLGSVVIGESRQERVRFVSRNGEPLVVEIQSAPDECSVELDEKSNPPEIIIITKLNEPGVWEGIIKCNVQASSREEVIEIKCVGYGRKSS